MNPSAGSSRGESRAPFVDWGLIDYREALARQQALVSEVAHADPDVSRSSRETIIFCTHPPVVTLGRGTQPGDVFGWAGETAEVNRGGRATYHGPSQIVVYPILDLDARGRDLHLYMRTLERAVVMTLAEFGIRAAGAPAQRNDDGTLMDATGVWIGPRKIASVGIGVRQWVSFHGLALNVDHDPNAFVGMKPCGFAPGTMLSMEEILGAPVDRARVQSVLARHLEAVLDAPLAARDPGAPASAGAASSRESEDSTPLSR